MAALGAKLVDFDANNGDHVDQFAEAFRKYSFVTFNDPNLSDDQHLALMARIGTVAADRPGAGPVAHLAHDPEKYKGFDPTNSNPGKFDDGELLFHFDFAFNDDWPCHAISLYALEIPPVGGDTLFVDGCGAYRRLSDDLKAKIDGRQALHLFDPYRTNGAVRTREATLGRYPERGMHDVTWPHPGGEGPVLTTAMSSTDRILGLPSDESEELLNKLFEVLYDPAAMLRHKWTVGDFVVWDNHVIQHSRENFDVRERRTLRRVINGDEVAIQRRVKRWKTQQPIDGTLAA
jgi:taurine dioxygenase